MDSDDKRALAGLAGTLIGFIQVSSIVFGIVSARGALTVIQTLQLLFCGSLLIAGILTLVTVHGDHHHNNS